MTYLLDTCAALWLWGDDKKLSTHARAVISDPSSTIVFHQVSYLEIVIKYSKGSLRLKKAPEILVREEIAHYKLSTAKLRNNDITRLRHLGKHHKDPFDRLLISFALGLEIPILTHDAIFPDYGVKVAW